MWGTIHLLNDVHHFLYRNNQAIICYLPPFVPLMIPRCLYCVILISTSTSHFIYLPVEAFFFSPILPNILTLFLNLFRQKSQNSMQCSRCSWTMGLQSILITHSFFAIHSFPNNSKPEATFSEWSKMVSQCCHLGQCQHHVLEQKQSVQSSSFYLRYFAPSVHGLD